MASLKDYERKRARGKTPEPFAQGAPGQGADLRRSSATTRGACTTTSGSSGTERSPAGRCRRACRWSPDSSTSRSTSRIIRSPTPRSRARSRPATTAPGRSRSGITARTSSSRRSRTAASPSGCNGERLDGLWTLVPAKLGGDAEELADREEEGGGARRQRKPRTYRPMLATLAADVPTGEGWLFEVKWDGFRAIATIRGGNVDLRSRNDKSFVERFPTVVRTLERALRTPDCVLDGEVVRRRRGRPGDVLGDAAGQGGHDVPLRRVRPARGGGDAADRPAAHRAARAARGARRHPAARDPDLRHVRRRPGVVRGGAGAALRGDHGQAGRLALRAGQALAQLAEAEDPGPAGARDRGVHERAGPPLRRASARSSSASTRTASCAGRGTSAPASTTPRSRGCSHA